MQDSRQESAGNFVVNASRPGLGSLLLPWAVLLACMIALAVWMRQLQPQAGLPVDMGENIAFGEEMLRAWHGQRINFKDDLPEVPCPDAYLPWLKSMPHIFFPATTTLSAAVAHVFPPTGPLQYPAAHFRVNILLTGVLGVVMMTCLGPILGRWFMVASFVLLMSLPRLFGEAVCNIKDFPQFVYAACFLCGYLRWRVRGGWGWLMLAGAMLGVGMATKPDTIFALAAVFLADLPWVWRRVRADGTFPARQTIFFALCLLVPAAVAVAVAYLPILTKLDENPIVFLARELSYAIAVNRNPSVGWNMHIPGYALAATPPLFCVAMLAGAVLAAKAARDSVLWRAMVLYFAIIVFRSVVPGTNPYGGLRQFLGFLFPASLFVVLLFNRMYLHGKEGGPLVRRAIAFVLFFMVAAGNGAAMHASSPYFTTYFSEVIGGLGGAQARGIPFAGDNWNLSYAEAARWLDNNAPPGARVAVFEYPHLLRHFIGRADIQVRQVEALEEADSDYIVTTRRREWRLNTPTGRVEPTTNSADPCSMQLVRQGGVVLSIVPPRR